MTRPSAVFGLSCVLALAGAERAAGQSDSARGTPTPAAIRARALRDSALVRTLNGISILGDTSIGNPLVGVRVLGTWGDTAIEDTDALLTRVYVTVNMDGQELRAFALGELREPAVERMATEGAAAVVYLTYGPEGRQRRRIRIEAALAGLRIRPAAPAPP